MVVIRKGIKLYSGRVDEMTASNGFFEIKVETNEEKLMHLLEAHPTIGNVKKEGELIIATLDETISATDFNTYLFENGIVLSHLVKRKPSLEQQFLDLTNNN